PRPGAVVMRLATSRAVMKATEFDRRAQATLCGELRAPHGGASNADSHAAAPASPDAPPAVGTRARLMRRGGAALRLHSFVGESDAKGTRHHAPTPSSDMDGCGVLPVGPHDCGCPPG